MKLCTDLKLQHITLEGDALQVINLMLGKTQDWNEGELLIKDAVNLCYSFDSWSVAHIHRSCNEAAHVIAKDAVNLVFDVIDLSSIPGCVNVVMHKDITC